LAVLLPRRDGPAKRAEMEIFSTAVVIGRRQFEWERESRFRIGGRVTS